MKIFDKMNPRDALFVKALLRSGGRFGEAGKVLTNKGSDTAHQLARTKYFKKKGVKEAFLASLDEAGLDDVMLADRWRDAIDEGWGVNPKHSDALKALVQVTKMKGLDKTGSLTNDLEKLMSESKEEITKKQKELLDKVKALIPEGTIVTD